MGDTNNDGELEQLLRDERAQRRAAETRVADLTAQVETWRTRAEERAERIEKLLAAGDAPVLRRWAGKVKTAWRVASEPDGDDGPPASRFPPMYPGLRIAAAVMSPGLANTVATTDVVAIDPVELAEADLVVLEPAAFSALPQPVCDEITRWAETPARQPLVIASDTAGPLEHAIRDGDLVAPIAPTFDPAKHHPGPPPDPVLRDGSIQRDGATLHLGASGPLLITGVGPLLADPPQWLVELAASGVAITTTERPEGADIPALGVAARRWAWRHHAPWRRVAELGDRLGIAAFDPTPTVAGILVSNRPEQVPRAIAAFVQQTHPSTELVVGLHGVEPTREIRKALDGAGIPTRLLGFDRTTTLGQCLNHAIESTGAPILAKIDDDDHYGAAHVEDAVHALAYSGASIVGKAAQFTYVASADRTVVRRYRQEEQLVDGSLTGATLVFRRSVWERVGFPHRPRRVDVLFERGARAAGARIYANSRWEFCYVRRGDDHTWSTGDDAFLAGSTPAWDGFHPERTEVADVTETP